MKCDPKLEGGIDQLIAKLEYGNGGPGLQCWYCHLLPGNLNRKTSISRGRVFSDITHCA